MSVNVLDSTCSQIFWWQQLELFGWTTGFHVSKMSILCFKEYPGRGLVFPPIPGYLCFYVSLKFCHFLSSPFSPPHEGPYPIRANAFILESVFSQDHTTGPPYLQVFYFSSSTVSVLIYHVSDLFSVNPHSGRDLFFLMRFHLYIITMKDQLYFPTSVYSLLDFLLLFAVWSEPSIFTWVFPHLSVIKVWSIICHGCWVVFCVLTLELYNFGRWGKWHEFVPFQMSNGNPKLSQSSLILDRRNWKHFLIRWLFCNMSAT